MENYTKGEVKELEDHMDFDVDENAVHMKVAAGSKIRNLMTYVMKQMKNPEVKQITWNGSGSGTSKTISCAEILKRKIRGLHQITNIRFKRIEEYWEPKLEGLERLKVNRDVPAITILLSKTPLDPTVAGYQPPGSFDAFWKKGTVSANEAYKGSKKAHKPPKATTPGYASQSDNPAFGDLTKKKRKRPAKDTMNVGQGEKKVEARVKSAKDTSQTIAGSPGSSREVKTRGDGVMALEQDSVAKAEINVRSKCKSPKKSPQSTAQTSSPQDVEMDEAAEEQ